MKKLLIFLILFIAGRSLAFSQSGVLPSAVPTKSQLAWAGLEYYLFLHFGPNTFTDLEWGKGTEQEEVFNPTALDCRQWCRVAIAAGARGIIITAKHHDGFCLWPSKFSSHTVRQSSWRGGQGDILKELSTACKEYGLKFGVYLSPWDRNHPEYGSPGYNDVYVNMMKEIVASYGPLFECWWDGANGEGPNGKRQVYDWHLFETTMRQIAPQTVIFSDIGPDIRWVGNENGIAGDPNWDLLDTAGFTRGQGAPPNDTLNHGNMYGRHWIPAECDVSIRPGWFYHAQEDGKVKTPAQLFQLWLKSVGRGANLLLNVPPDRRGLISAYDSTALAGFRALREKAFSKPLASVKYGKEQWGRKVYTVQFGKPSAVNCIVLSEFLDSGQQIVSFSIDIMDRDRKSYTIRGNTIGHKRILTFPTQVGTGFVLTIRSQKQNTFLKKMEAYRIEESDLER